MTKNPNCASCIHAVRMAGRKGIRCGHGSSMGNYTITEARRRPRWIELLSFRGLCGITGTFFYKKPRKAREKKEEPAPFLVLMDGVWPPVEGSNE